MIASSRPRITFVLAMLLASLLGGAAGCATAGPAPGAAVRISANVPDATVWVDDRLAGKVTDFANGARRLPVGYHRVEIRAPGYYSSVREIDVKAGTEVALDAQLHAVLE